MGDYSPRRARMVGDCDGHQARPRHSHLADYHHHARIIFIRLERAPLLGDDARSARIRRHRIFARASGRTGIVHTDLAHPPNPLGRVQKRQLLRCWTPASPSPYDMYVSVAANPRLVSDAFKTRPMNFVSFCPYPVSENP